MLPLFVVVMTTAVFSKPRYMMIWNSICIVFVKRSSQFLIALKGVLFLTFGMLLLLNVMKSVSRLDLSGVGLVACVSQDQLEIWMSANSLFLFLM